MTPVLLLSLLVACGKTVPPLAADGAPVEATDGRGVAAADVVGSWGGTLDAGVQKLRLVLEVRDGAGGLEATLISLDQGNARIEAASVGLEQGALVVAFPGIRASYRGEIDGDTMSGPFVQGVSMPLVLTRGVHPDAPRRPQDPVGDVPYTATDVRIEAAGHSLAGTLTTPPGEGPFPGVVLVSGSGPQNRDEELMGHRPFLVLADHLTRRGIVVLRYDDRGFGESTGDFAQATTSDFADDALAAADWLRGRDEVGAVGLVGHSEGGTIGPIASERGELDFLVLLAPMTVPIQEVLADQSVRIQAAAGVPPEALERSREVRTRLYDLLGRPDVPLDEVVAVARELPDARAMPEDALRANVASLHTPWTHWLREHPPGPFLEALDVPTLALFGSKDVQVHPSVNAPPLEGRSGVEVQTFEGLNHLFQPAETGSLTEYGSIDITIDPAVLERVSGWILATAP